MLKIVGCHACEETAIEFDEYLPFKFSCKSQGDSPHLYWRTGNMETTLLEIKIDIIGNVIGASLFLPGHISRKFPIINFSGSAEVKGYPIVCIDDWSNDRFKDEPNPIRVFVDSSRLLILLSTSITVSKIITSQNITFGVDGNDFLNCILFKNLQYEKLMELENLQ